MRGRFDFAFNLFVKRSIASDGDRQLDVGPFAEAPYQRGSFLLTRIDKVEDSSRSRATVGIPIVRHLRESKSHGKSEISYLLLGNVCITKDLRRIFVSDQEIITGAPVPDRVHRDRISDHRNLRKTSGLSVRIDCVDNVIVNGIS